MVYADTSPPDILLRKKLDAVEKVKQAFGDMVIALLKEQTHEIKYKDFCVKEFHKTQLEIEGWVHAKSDLLTKILKFCE